MDEEEDGHTTLSSSLSKRGKKSNRGKKSKGKHEVEHAPTVKFPRPLTDPWIRVSS